MTGMKKGAGEDPFADDQPVDSTEPSTDQTEATETPEETDTQQEPDTQSSRQQLQIPYKFRRDGVQDGRDRVPLFLQKETKVAERDALREFEDRFEENVSLTDLREALVKVGLQHLDEAEDCLEEWGYGMTFD
ncbi:hypothetical protein E6P09_18870 (plasmid) [Haloferax mediterranei ATCC 33500]|uniref:Uncharacterized protein n=1 Tax=Haloferax mediterranei (strain ATCC 33500 / DSM 1411 / JCM 8866 / NBRC 14739 / NCIMB 2177 / R-4) TaxID=523841 RepID=I3R8Y8_HALMT|nr:hypothetical protein [Haloferax mediterranei]AFK20698.1 hypothetical protein HFX_4002 [Haloferax mediterranei ATCC 33500]AHZ24044.1 hypothetical protein BM92_19785 [Haloferax mediterranei ATCC 33500]ELZ97630.1 hypothetical protein C439_16978 [Haloferax mediterranei ATCC 33500]MDX5989716.1 hypothetical protein [Haloferax mediterranei ATCC 33500]QCQ77384.1 hypothetical protein E6P09_18870 [Haloferax mediterranei ATCC 33500]